MSTTVAILSHHRHPRLRYVLKTLSQDLGYQLRLFTDHDKWLATEAVARATYGVHLSDTTIAHLPANQLLSGRSPSPEDLAVSWSAGVPVFCNGDLLACCFFALSRYEEYQPFTPDTHGRFPAASSHALANDYLELPVVRIWAARLDEQLRSFFPQLPARKSRPLTFRPTYDIDLLWAYRHRGWRGTASGIRDLLSGQWQRAKDRLFTDADHDPYLTLEYLLQLHPEHQPDIFWLLADNGAREDVNPYPIPAEQQAMMRQLSARATMGIHPGYQSIEQPAKVKEEFATFASIFGRPVQHSRQHFLRFRLPETYRQLRLLGITNEHSMGYADAIGWRAGTNLPFFWYDLEEEQVTGLTVHPFAAMDGTLKNYLKLTPGAATERVLRLAASCRPYGGDFPLLWHNSSFAAAHGWSGWREVYEDLVAKFTIT